MNEENEPEKILSHFEIWDMKEIYDIALERHLEEIEPTDLNDTNT
jgi:hypothetical protein